MFRIIDINGYIWKPYQFSDEYFYCCKLDKIEWIKNIKVKKILEV